MTIKEVEAMLPVTRANVRFYEKEGLLFPKRNPVNDYRDYSAQDVETLKKILFLRHLDISVEQIRLLQQEKVSVHAVAADRLIKLEDEAERTENIRLILERLREDETVDFESLEVSYDTEIKEEPSLKEAAGALMPFWEKLVVWGAFILEVLYTLAILPMLPERIPTEWQGTTAVEWRSKYFVLFYVLVSLGAGWGIRVVLYRPLYLAWRQYLDQICAVLSVGAIGLMLASEVYTVMSLKGTSIGCGLFLTLCGAAYLGMSFLIARLHGRISKK